MLTRSIVVAYSVIITCVCIRVFTPIYLSAGPATECVSSIACAFISVCASIAAGACIYCVSARIRPC
jgi:hypothetical protein